MDDKTRAENASRFHHDIYAELADDYTQCEFLLQYLTQYGSITPLEALTAFGCLRLSARIADLRADGYSINTEIHKGKKNYAIYRLEDKQDEQ